MSAPRQISLAVPARAAGVVVLAYVLILQALLAGMGWGLAADPFQTAVAQVHCLPSGGDAPLTPGVPHQPGSLCCVLGCAGGVSAAVLPQAATAPFRIEVRSVELVAPAEAAVRVRPGAFFRARGPPAIA
jgi:hypothetical protein